MFPKLASQETINFVTNPHKFEIANGVEFLGTSGRNMHDIQLYSKPAPEDPSEEKKEDTETSYADQLKRLLEQRHLCPTAPDTLRCFPFSTDDPFVIERSPDVMFAGCQPSYSEQLIYQHKKTKESAVKIISVPTFALTRSIVLVDLETLESYELSFGDRLVLEKEEQKVEE